MSSTPQRVYGGVSASKRVAARRERLLEAGLECFGTCGFAVTGVKDVCREAGLTDRYFYESFRDKGELFIALFDRETAALLVMVGAAVAGVEPKPESQVRAAIGSFIGALDEDRRRARLIFTEAAAAGPEAARHMRATLRDFAGLIVATATPHLPADTPTSAVEVGALALVGAIERVVVEWHDGALAVATDDVVEYLVGFYLSTADALGIGRQ